MKGFAYWIGLGSIILLMSCKQSAKLGSSLTSLRSPDINKNSEPARPEEESTNTDELIIGGLSPASQGDNCDGSFWGFDDPLMKYQWHLCNSAQDIPGFSVPGEVAQDGRFLASFMKYSGEGITIKVTDSGLERTHEDITDNDSGMGKDFCENAGADHDSDPVVKHEHGTMVSGIIAARGKNNIGMAGILHQAKITADNLISECQRGDTQTKFTNAITFDADIWNGSYGYACDSGWVPRNENPMTYQAFTLGATNNNTVYVKANGNDRSNCRPNGNADPENTHPYVLSIAAVDNKGETTSYSSQGANLALSGFAGYGFDDNPGICTTLTNGNYTCGMNGTSAAAPFVSGIAGLVKEANPNLKFIDIHSILMRTARKTKDQDYIANDAGYEHSWNAGFGLVDSDAAIKLAETYQNYLEIPVRYSESKNNDNLLSVNNQVSFTADNCGTQTLSIPQDFQIFAMELGFNIEVNTDVRDLEIFIRTPGGKRFPLNRTSNEDFINIIGQREANNLGSALSVNQVIMSKQFFGMEAKGDWILEACNTEGTFNSVQVEIIGWNNNVIPKK